MRLSIFLYKPQAKDFELPPEIVINGRWNFGHVETIGKTRIYESSDLDWLDALDSIFVVEPSQERFFERGELVTRASIGPAPVGGTIQAYLPGLETKPPRWQKDRERALRPRRVLVRLLDRFLVPDFRSLRSAGVHLVEEFYDHIAHRYDKLIISELTSAVWCNLFKASGLLDCPIKKSKARVLDFGVGTGYTTRQALRILFGHVNPSSLPFELYGADLSDKMVKTCEEQAGFLFREIKRARYSEKGLDFRDGFFDLVLMCFVEDAFPQAKDLYEMPFEEIRRVLVVDGILAFNIHKPTAESIQNTRETLIRLGFTTPRIIEAEFHTGGQYRLIPLVITHRGSTHQTERLTPKRSWRAAPPANQLSLFRSEPISTSIAHPEEPTSSTIK